MNQFTDIESSRSLDRPWVTHWTVATKVAPEVRASEGPEAQWVQRLEVKDATNVAPGLTTRNKKLLY